MGTGGINPKSLKGADEVPEWFDADKSGRQGFGEIIEVKSTGNTEEAHLIKMASLERKSGVDTEEHLGAVAELARMLQKANLSDKDAAGLMPFMHALLHSGRGNVTKVLSGSGGAIVLDLEDGNSIVLRQARKPRLETELRILTPDDIRMYAPQMLDLVNKNRGTEMSPEERRKKGYIQHAPRTMEELIKRFRKAIVVVGALLPETNGFATSKKGQKLMQLTGFTEWAGVSTHKKKKQGHSKMSFSRWIKSIKHLNRNEKRRIVNTASHFAHSRLVVVSEDNRERGVGTGLYLTAAMRAEEMGKTQFIVEIPGGNIRSLMLHTFKMGAEPIGFTEERHNMQDFRFEIATANLNTVINNLKATAIEGAS